MSAHYWAPTVLSPDGKPFDRKLIKVLLGLPTVNVLIIVFLYEDKLLVHLGAKKCYHRFCTFYMPAETVGKMGICWKQHVFFLMITPPTPSKKRKKNHRRYIFFLYIHSTVLDRTCCRVSVSRLFVAWALSVRTFTMPSGQHGRTLWNVPKLSNRFQVLRATGQPPTITPLCVLCDRTQQ